MSKLEVTAAPSPSSALPSAYTTTTTIPPPSSIPATGSGSVTPASAAGWSFPDPNALLSNPLFAGGLGLAGLGTAAALARTAVIRGARLLRRQMLVNVEISKRDPAYTWVLAWLSQPRPNSGFLARRLTRLPDLSLTTAATPLGPESDYAAVGGGGGSGGPVKAAFLLQPGYGRYVIRHRPGVYIAVHREKTNTARMDTGEPHETITLTSLYAHRHVFEEVFREAHAISMRANEGKTVVYMARQMRWEPYGDARKKRPLDSVVLDHGVKESIVDDVNNFLARQRWYVDRGIPYRRGYLLYGPPGSGKSSFIQALAGELDYGIAMINLSETGLTDDRLGMLLTTLPKRSIVVLEDADAAFVNRRARDADGYTGKTVTFSGLLNAMDGISAGEERMAFLTTNHVDRLDPALIRPGRVDMMVRIGEATRYQAALMWDRFYGDMDADRSGRERFLARLDKLGLFGTVSDDGVLGRHTSTAAIQGLFLFNKDNMEGAIDMAEGLIPRTFEPASVDPEATIRSPA